MCLHKAASVQDFNNSQLVIFRTPQRPLSADMSEWNPFGDENFADLSEDTIFGREFDRLRRGSNSSKCRKWLSVCEKTIGEGVSSTVQIQVIYFEYKPIIFFHTKSLPNLCFIYIYIYIYIYRERERERERDRKLSCTNRIYPQSVGGHLLYLQCQRTVIDVSNNPVICLFLCFQAYLVWKVVKI